MKRVYNFHNSFLLSLMYLLDSYLNHRAPLEYQTKCCCLEWLQLGVPNLLEYFSNQWDWVLAGYATNLSSPLPLKGLHFHFSKLQFIKKRKKNTPTLSKCMSCSWILVTYHVPELCLFGLKATRKTWRYTPRQLTLYRKLHSNWGRPLPEWIAIQELNQGQAWWSSGQQRLGRKNT